MGIWDRFSGFFRAQAQPSTHEKGYVKGELATWADFGAEQDDANPDLRWPLSIDIYDRMRKEESQVKSVLKAVTLPIRRANWALDPTGCREEVVARVSRCMDLPVQGRPPAPSVLRRRNRFSWQEHLRLALLELPFGHAVFEQVYEYDEASGLFDLKKLAYRPPRTIAEWKVARDGGLEWIRQHDMKPGEKLDINRLVVYTNEREGANWQGESLLRSAYKNWLLKDRILRSQALTIDRNGLGVPIYEQAAAPEDASWDQAREWDASERANGLELAKAYRAGETAGASISPGAKLLLRGVEGELPDTDKPIRYHDEQIARAVLAHFLNLGTETGSWALGSTFADFFASSLQAQAMHTADVTQQHVIDDLVDVNWGESEPAPRLVFDEIGSKTAATADAIKALVECGAIKPDETLEAHVRQAHGLPVMDPATRRAEVAEAA